MQSEAAEAATFYPPSFPFIQNITNILLIFPNHSKNKIYIDIYNIETFYYEE
jgi:hypothetical protein